MGIFRYRAVKQLEEYQAIADAYTQLNAALEYRREKEQEFAAAELEEMLFEMEADAERCRQEYEEEMRELGLDAYDWDSLLEANEDVKGWLYLPDTPIDLPVVGTSDNDYYLTHDFWKQKKSTGCPFMDKDTGQWDFNRTVYAHNMGGASDTMFSPLLRFKDEDYFMAHRQLYYTQCYGITAEYQIMAAVKYNAKDTGSWDFRTRNHADMEGYNLWMEQLQEYALY
jgi:sortase B